ncbi:MAG: prepilin-type N-terminal cleavage/methylation domain-containing protein [Rhizobacter sp.]|nr:prepilin-type N-terminal cleavage/methylation domain-containing protein [Rhizobacter sp.]
MQRGTATGFTLVEVLVALMVMAIMAAMAWQGVDGIVRARTASQARLEQTLRMNTVIAQWEQDLDAVQETTVLPSALSFDGATLRLTRRVPGGLQLVVWSLVPEAGGNVWLRWAGPAVTTGAALQEYWQRSQQFQGNEAGQLRTLSGIEQWQMYYFYGNAWSNAQSTGNLAAPAPGASAPPRQALPSGVRLVLSFAPGSGHSGSLVRDTLLGL